MAKDFQGNTIAHMVAASGNTEVFQVKHLWKGRAYVSACRRGIELLCICTSYVCLRQSASRRCCLQESCFAHWCRYTRRLTTI